ncbi:MAG: hypothetical protein AUJ51_02090 [Elusimicrobia bacterium CG1_02_56_21]|nr:MAG: hypothetical protein AUJ51_02090 [Elusimicrobia bacterium CG1_02_56_21]
MKINISSYIIVSAGLLCLMAAPAPAQNLPGAVPQVSPVEAAGGIRETDTPADSAEFTKNERDYAQTDPSYFTLNKDSIKLTLLEVTEEPDMNYVRLQEDPMKPIDGILVTIDKIINIASKVWNIIQQNAPVVNIETKYATAYPYGITSASQLAQWSRPKSYTYGFYAENLYGSVMIDCKYKFSYSYNGAYKGKGKFLTGVAVIPTSVKAGWGYRFYMSAAVPDSTIVNAGTDKDPVAAMQMKLSWKMATVLKEVDGTSVYYVQGNGYFEEIASPWKKGPAVESVNSAAPLLDTDNIF